MLRMKFDVPKLTGILQSAADAHAALMAVGDRVREARQAIAETKAAIASDEKRFPRSSSENYNRLSLLQEHFDQLQQQQQRLSARYTARNAVAASCRGFAEKNGWRDPDSKGASFSGVNV